MSSSAAAAKGAAGEPHANEELHIEEADDPIKPDHYIFIDNLRLVRVLRLCVWMSVPHVSDGVTGGCMLPPQVRPYYFDFKCSVKQRWEGQPFVEAFAQVRSCS